MNRSGYPGQIPSYLSKAPQESYSDAFRVVKNTTTPSVSRGSGNHTYAASSNFKSSLSNQKDSMPSLSVQLRSIASDYSHTANRYQPSTKSQNANLFESYKQLSLRNCIRSSTHGSDSHFISTKDGLRRTEVSDKLANRLEFSFKFDKRSSVLSQKKTAQMTYNNSSYPVKEHVENKNRIYSHLRDGNTRSDYHLNKAYSPANDRVHNRLDIISGIRQGKNEQKGFPYGGKGTLGFGRNTEANIFESTSRSDARKLQTPGRVLPESLCLDQTDEAETSFDYSGLDYKASRSCSHLQINRERPFSRSESPIPKVWLASCTLQPSQRQSIQNSESNIDQVRLDSQNGSFASLLQLQPADVSIKALADQDTSFEITQLDQDREHTKKKLGKHLLSSPLSKDHEVSETTGEPSLKAELSENAIKQGNHPNN